MNLLADALRAETLGASLGPIMAALGIKTGDVAAAVFSALPLDGHEWPDLSLEERRDWLAQWFRIELLYATQEVMDKPHLDL